MAGLRDLIRFERSQGIQLPGWLDRLISLGITTKDPKVARRQRIVNVASFAAAANSISRFVSGFFYFFDSPEFLMAQAISGVFAVAALLIHRSHRYGDNAGAVALTFWFLSSVSFAAFMLGLQSQILAYFPLAGVLLFVFGVENWRQFLVWLAVLVAVMIVLLNYAPEQGIATAATPQVLGVVSLQTLINAVAINTALIFYVLVVLQRTERDLERESERAEALLAVVLPERIAERLRVRPDARIADRIDTVTLLFADLENFTPVAHAEDPEAVVAYLDEFVRTFDLMCQSFGVEKIKSIGDAYMAAGGLRGDAREGAIAIGALALEMKKAQIHRPMLGGRHLQLRIGIHSGTAIAGVIGDTRITYDLWGDAVNVASRMESFGVPGRIHVSHAFRRLTEGAFEFEERGPTEIKGIGIARTYFLLSQATGETAILGRGNAVG